MVRSRFQATLTSLFLVKYLAQAPLTSNVAVQAVCLAHFFLTRLWVNSAAFDAIQSLSQHNRPDLGGLWIMQFWFSFAR